MGDKVAQYAPVLLEGEFVAPEFFLGRQELQCDLPEFAGQFVVYVLYNPFPDLPG
tara:strand:- start:32173 stop:32337 length:165 start_codon:yes stop_codon:yes gene_type:complete